MRPTKNQSELISRLEKGHKLWFNNIDWVYHTRFDGWHRENLKTVNGLIHKGILIKGRVIEHHIEYILKK